VTPLALSCLASDRRSQQFFSGQNGADIMPSYYSPELVETMRAALNEVMKKVPVDQATPGIKAYMAEFILKAAAAGQTNYDDLLQAASQQIQTALSQLI
jgi:hypothetical protein